MNISSSGNWSIHFSVIVCQILADLDCYVFFILSMVKYRHRHPCLLLHYVLTALDHFTVLLLGL